jgi:tight adherence protein B
VVQVSGRQLPVVDRWRERRAVARRDEQLPEALERIASALRAGRSIGTAVCDTAAAAEPPLGPELSHAAAALDAGAGLERAVQAWVTVAGPSRDVALAATAIGLGGRAGGEVARALDRVAATLRERRELRAEVRALATQARASAGVLTVAPLAFAAIVSTVEPGVVGFLVGSPIGWLCLAAGLGLDGLGALWMARIVRSVA